METIDIRADSSSGAAGGRFEISPQGLATNWTYPVSGAPMPTVVPASELYFWSEKWRVQEREFEDARAAGQLIEAGSMDEVIRDLMRVDDEPS